MSAARYRIVPCRTEHLREMARTMRAEDRAEIEGAGLVTRHALARLWRGSIEPRAAIVDGEVAAVWGDESGLFERVGRMWAFTAPPVARLPLAFFRETRREVAEKLAYRHVLVADVADSYLTAQRFFRLLGFTIGEPFLLGGAAYRRMTIARDSLG